MDEKGTQPKTVWVVTSRRGRMGMFGVAIAIAVAAASVTGIEDRIKDTQRLVAADMAATFGSRFHRGDGVCRRYPVAVRADPSVTASVTQALKDARLWGRLDTALLTAWVWTQEAERGRHEANEFDEIERELLGRLSWVDRLWMGVFGSGRIEESVDALATPEVRARADILATFTATESARLRQLWDAHPDAFSRQGMQAIVATRAR